jgi:HD superfamily phosphohydrolase
MNKAKKEEKRKYEEARKGLTVDQVMVLDKKEKKQKEIEDLARTIHAEKFSEEYDFMYDSTSDLSDRKKGINPMSQEYIDKINIKRSGLGVSPLSERGTSTSNDTMDMCIEEAKKIIDQ